MHIQFVVLKKALEKLPYSIVFISNTNGTVHCPLHAALLIARFLLLAKL